MNKNGEISILDLDCENESYYEVELWESGDCEGHFFKYKQDANKFFKRNAKTLFDCIKFHQSEIDGGEVRIIKENENVQKR